MNALVVIEHSAPVVFAEALELANDFAKPAKSAATQRAYSSDIAIFTARCRGRGLNALPASAEVVAAFLASQAALGKDSEHSTRDGLRQGLREALSRSYSL